MYSLHILTGPWKGKRLTVREPALLIGREADCGLQLPDDEISRKHAVLEERPDGVIVRDMGSMNGFLLNGQPAREARLADGHIVEMGRTRIQFRLPGPVSARRRLGWLQGMTILLVAGLLLLQMFFLVAVSTRSKDLLFAAERALTAPAEKPAPAAVANPEPKAPPAEPAPDRPTEPAPLPSDERPEAAAVTDELADIRAEVESLRRQMAETVPEPPPEPAPTPAAPDPEPEDPLLLRARELLDEAALEIQRSNLLQADHLLERIQIMAPDFLPAYLERARLYEQRGQLVKAGEQWAEVLRRSAGTPLYEQAAAERIRIARAQALRPPPASPAQRRDAAGAETRLPRRIRIASIEQEKLPDTERYEEMRLVRVGLRPVASERAVDTDEIRVAVYFFDEDRASRDVSPTQAVTQRNLLRVEGEWISGGVRSVTGTYVVPPGARDEEERKTGRRMRYYGYAVRVYYREELQDEDARPKALLEKVRKLPSPFHAAPSAARPASPPRSSPAPAPPAPAQPSEFTAPGRP